MKLYIRRQTIRPRHRFATSQGGMDEKEIIVVSIEHDGITGLGECVPSRLYGQSLETSEDALRGMRDAGDSRGPAGILGDDPFQIEAIVSRAIEHFDGQRAAIAALDSALHDWVGKRLNTPVWRLLGLPRAQARTTFTIGVAGPDETREKICEALADGYDALKVKVGVESDDETLSYIRERFDGPLYMDANAAWEPGEAEGCIRRLARFKPHIIEQPLKAEFWREMAALRRLGVAPIIADESCERPTDVVRLRDAVDGVNIKFTKCGGIREALRMFTLARAFGMRVMLGCFVCSGLAIAPALAIATLVDDADLDGHLLLANDPFMGIERRGSTILLGDAPGLGVAPNPSAATSLPTV